MPAQFDLSKFKKLGSLAEAAQVLDELQESGSYENLRQAMTHPLTEIKNEAVKRIKQAGDKHALPELIKALQHANVPAMGSEHATAQTVYKENLIKAVNALSGQNFNVADANNLKELSEVVSRMTRWTDENL
ncbi:hypothetical protein ACN9ML_19680 [Dyadobacter endophyticus]|uniref:HEAT repeat domain-containing protein n=1 Tax=Dyadobacter endophyticus TaxID=1749036 RepID=A0ABQ1ZA12_9BACT|nr:hypothetical protein [Dyadobacter endophyticus]GGH55151.1 hypothetical protein GCM10007423_62370 [Dyadobacter endophyticus]